MSTEQNLHIKSSSVRHVGPHLLTSQINYSASAQSWSEKPSCPQSSMAASTSNECESDAGINKWWFAAKTLSRFLHSHLLDAQSPSPSVCARACTCVLLLVETYFRQNASIDGSQVNGILAIVIHTVNYLTERRVIFQIVCATAGYLPRVSVRHECPSWNGSFICEK